MKLCHVCSIESSDSILDDSTTASKLPFQVDRNFCFQKFDHSIAWVSSQVKTEFKCFVRQA
jgi:hypothetical protein